MATRTQIKSVKKQRLSSKGGHRRRAKSKKSVTEKRKLRITGKDVLLDSYYHEQQIKGGFRCVK